MGATVGTMAPGSGMLDARPSWSTPREAIRVVFLRSTMRKTTRIALVVGTILSVINQGYLIWGGRTTYVTWIRVVANYVVPFCVSSTGFLSATKTRRSAGE